MSVQQKTREQIAEKDKWKLEDIYADDALWEKDFNHVRESIPRLAQYKGRLHESAETLAAYLKESAALEEIIGRLYAYAHMRNDEDKTVSLHQEQYDRMGGLLVEYNQTVSFFEPEILAMDEQHLRHLLESATELAVYRHYFDNMLRVKPHILSEQEERLMALSGEVRGAPADIFSNWDNADVEYPIIMDEQGQDVRLTNALYGKFQQSADRRVRKDSYLALHKPYLEHRNMLAASYGAIVKSHIFNARARHHKSSLHAALNANNIPVEVYHNLIETTRTHTAPLQRYLKLRKRILKLNDGVYDYDLRAPLFSMEQRLYSWDEARQMVLEGAAALGDDYRHHLEKGFKERWIDVYENKGKRSGAYSSGTYGVHPYVLMNYNGTLNDIFTLTHEMGHAMHTWYTINNQPFVYGDYPIFLAEVASTANEALLEKYLIDRATDTKEKLAVLNTTLDGFNSTFYRQVLFAEFEWRSHQLAEEGQALTAEKLNDLFGSIYQDYYGEEFTVLDETRALWSRVPHFYYNFYVFQYSTSFVASAALVSKILEEGEPARERYLNFLKSGRSRYAMDTLKEAGVDMTRSEPVLRTIKRMDALLDQVEALL
ncbi:MAG: oligoendopeptidase F [Calditrichaeota bacterium]|nr:MAG: oligoendopeptidase F [Calditrichota bacterium]